MGHLRPVVHSTPEIWAPEGFGWQDTDSRRTRIITIQTESEWMSRMVGPELPTLGRRGPWATPYEPREIAVDRTNFPLDVVATQIQG